MRGAARDAGPDRTAQRADARARLLGLDVSRHELQGKDNIAVAGPAEIQSLHTPLDLDWHRKAESLNVGPNASLTVYEVQGFRGQERTVPPGFEVQQLRKDLGFIQSIDALKLNCK